MEHTYYALATLSAALFLYYGISCLISEKMIAEFERFGASRYRRLTGWLEIAGALGVAAGLLEPALMVPAAGGLTLLMGLVVVQRIQLRDSLSETLPALVLMVGDGFVTWYAAVEIL